MASDKQSGGFFFPPDSDQEGPQEGKSEAVAPAQAPAQAPIQAPGVVETFESEPKFILGLWYLYFQPQRFFKQVVVEPAPLLTAICAWLFGMAGVIDQIDKQHLKGSALTEQMGWGVYLGTVVVLGILGGLVYYGIGGWWYRVRLGWSGVSDADPPVARRIYLYASMVAAIPIVLATLGQVAVYSTPAEMMDAVTPEAIAVMLVLLLFVIWSIWTSYNGVTTVYESIVRGRAIVWFLVLPGLFTLPGSRWC